MADEKYVTVLENGERVFDSWRFDIAEPLFVWKGECIGVCISQFEHGKYLKYTFLVHDDGQWLIDKHGHTGISAYWLPEAIEALQQAEAWLSENAKRGDWGWRKI